MNTFTSIAEAPYPQGSYRDIVDYVTEVVSHDPSDLFAQTGKPLPSRMPQTIAQYVDGSVPAEHLRRVHVGENPRDGNVNMTGVIQGALMDTRDFLKGCFDTRINDITPESAARIIHAPTTLYVLAGLALQAGSKEGENTDMTPDYRRSFAINDDMTAIEITGAFVVSKDRGCPFAGKNGEIKPTPIFKDLGQWAGVLATQAYFNHFHKIDPTAALRNVQQ